jgi:hypothetical protein
MLRHVVWQKFTNISEVLTAFIITLMREAESTSETSAYFYQTTCATFQKTVICMFHFYSATVWTGRLGGTCSIDAALEVFVQQSFLGK